MGYLSCNCVRFSPIFNLSACTEYHSALADLRRHRRFFYTSTHASNTYAAL